MESTATKDRLCCAMALMKNTCVLETRKQLYLNEMLIKVTVCNQGVTIFKCIFYYVKLLSYSDIVLYTIKGMILKFKVNAFVLL